MSNLTFELDAETRNDIGKGASRRLRHANLVPAIIYGAGEKPVSLTLNHDKVAVALSHEAFYSHILTLKVNKKNEKVILKAIQRHPAKPRIQHIDFQRVRADQKLHMHIPLHFLGAEDAPGVKDGGIVTHNMADVEVSCLPADLPEHIEVDVSEMAMNQVIHLSELKLPKGVELVALTHGIEGHDLPVVSIHLPQVEEEPIEAVEEVVAEGAEGEATAFCTPEESTETKKPE
ncbi:MAG: 50S ribosomal protein L25/general stress protein Ctc [Firmicutes bacterium]|nr:50S ribosomal protein L25/general stress protein Ctc [Bacillota bacterium]